ncbi:D-xylulose 5-phosphate/D-fructose 6-phosphate phosphoketolase [Mytilinidion resinicola]|uniref:D-xylulose 5-phosphate/D-fructose 6-phosphate phosphoketolase n=1 Tax=Mytilinidion resinicola TaxID=574789 RepID=A0A6A6Y5G1_9PEZI|nr:D-xylulose 5-phosphate/D-fructose 6-phosphate phosphoketolase [Mytilinidion resinicola]KAF2804032.1 D-xylulose 5-phosphate/D-fructose 6-phosphate phosphoketolase [Mytilinidion resinicola]
MPGEVIDRPNPEPSPSNLPDDVLSLAVKIEKKPLPEDAVTSLKEFRRAACYIAAAMIFLKDNSLLERDLTFEDVKPRLLGHWGTCPGLILVYSHLNYLVRKHEMDMIYVVGPGHGAPAILASLWLEGSMARFYPEFSRDRKGLHKLITKFSVTGGPPSHINAETPGSIHEGGELGYALGVSFGAVMDKPDLVVTCIVGDGEAETGPTATAWHSYKYIDPKESGAVIPIVHVNGFKISERTIYGCMDNKELAALFSGYGYKPRFVEDIQDIDTDLGNSLEWALGEIRRIQKAAREDKPIMKPRWPVIIMRTPKGWSGPKKVDGEFLEGSFHSHQVPLMKAKTDPQHLEDLQGWLKSYNPEELFNKDGSPVKRILDIIPENDDKKLGQLKETYDPYIDLKVPDWTGLAVEKGGEESCMQLCGKLMGKAFQDNPRTLRIFSPDELESNKLGAVFDHTNRNFQWDEFSNGRGGRVIEILSEHCCQAFMQGYTLTGRTALFPSYESFLGIIHTMMVQYAKFGKMAQETSWRRPIGSLNYLETSTWTRQEHNGFSHQNPSFIGAILNLKPTAARVYLPPDANCFLSTLSHCLRSKMYINLMVGSKQPSPVFLSPKEAEDHCRAGASIWEFASVDKGLNPDVVLVGIGAELTYEVIKAVELLRELAPALRIRVVNVTDLMVLGTEGTHPHALNDQDFDALFTADKPVHFNYHGYASELKGLLFERPQIQRITVESYREEGSTTTPFDMMLLNHVSRYHVMEYALRGGAKSNEKVSTSLVSVLADIKHRAQKTRDYILAEGEDPADTYKMPRLEGMKIGGGGGGVMYEG